MGDLTRWGLQGGVAVVDQGLISASNFLVNILLARWLDPAAYGAFAVAFSVFLLISGIHNALLLEPITVLGPTNYGSSLPRYFGKQLRIHFVLTAFPSAILIVIGLSITWLKPVGPLGGALLGAGTALPLILLLWVARRFFYVVIRPSGALLGSAAYPVLVLSGLGICHKLGWISPMTGFFLMGLASLISTVIAIQVSGLLREPDQPSGKINYPSLLREQWQYGRWLLAATLLYSAATQVQTFLAAIMLGLGEAGVLRATQIPSLPMVQAITAISTLGLPALSSEFGRGGSSAMRRKGNYITLALTAIAVLYEALLLLSPHQLAGALYGGKYSAQAWLIPIQGLVPVFAALASGYSLTLRAAQRPRLYLVTVAVQAPVGLLSSVVLMNIWGLTGAALSSVLTYAVAAWASYHFSNVALRSCVNGQGIV